MENEVLAPEIEFDAAGQQLHRTQVQHRKRNNASVTHTDVSRTNDVHEQTPLLPRRASASSEASSDSGIEWPGQRDFEGRPWYRKPSIWWIIPPYLIFMLAFGGTIVPKLNLIADLVCREYYSRKHAKDPNFTYAPIKFGASDPQCAAPGVQQSYTAFAASVNLIGGILSAISCPKLGSLSDRYGRRFIICVTTIGMFLGEVLTICAGTYPDTFPLYWFYVGFAVDGICGSFAAAVAITNCYASDCTPPRKRAIAFGYFYACLFAGIGLGPFLAGQIIRATGSMITIFYAALVCHLIFIFSILFIVPESLSESRQAAARTAYEKQNDGRVMGISEFLGMFRSFFQPLKILFPRGSGTSPALRRNMIILSTMDAIMIGVAIGSMTVVIIYVRSYFNWTVEDQSNFVSAVNTCRVVVLIFLLPLITRLVKGPSRPDEKHVQNGCDKFDLWVIRIAFMFDTIGYVGYATSKTGIAFVLSGCVASFGSVGSATMQSALTKHVPPSRVGELLGSLAFLSALTKIVAPLLFAGIYWATVQTMPRTIFICLTSAFAVTTVMSFFLRPGVYLQADQTENVSQDESYPETAQAA